MKYQPQDHYFQKAKQEGYRARSVYKLEAIQDRFHLLRPGQHVLDLGAAPGSFLQYISKIVGEKGQVIGVDLKPIKPFPEKNIQSFVADILEEMSLEEELTKRGVRKLDVIVSDLAPSTSGIRFLDGGRSKALNERVIGIAEHYLKRGGHLVLKLLPGLNESDLTALMKPLFTQVRHLRPPAVRKSSGEWYLVGLQRL